MTARSCEFRRYSFDAGRNLVESDRCGQTVAALDVAFTLAQVDQLMGDPAASPSPVVVAYCADHAPRPRPRDPGWEQGAYAAGVIWLPVEGPRAP